MQVKGYFNKSQYKKEYRGKVHVIGFGIQRQKKTALQGASTAPFGGKISILSPWGVRPHTLARKFLPCLIDESVSHSLSPQGFA
jgi:hypothetical protein